MLDTNTLKDELRSIRASAQSYFKEAVEIWMKSEDARRAFTYEEQPFFESMPDHLKVMVPELEAKIFKCAGQMTEMVSSSSLLGAADQSDLRINIRKLAAALRFREYQYYETNLMSWEDQVFGVQPASQSENAIDVRIAAEQFESALDKIDYLTHFVHEGQYRSQSPTQRAPAISGSQHRPDTAFIMMWMSDEHPELSDVKAGIVEVFREFGIEAIRADDIEHDDVITDRIIKEITSAEFLIADLTGARPNVYYEVGYAHALGKRVILYRKKDAPIHFDLAEGTYQLIPMSLI